MQRIIVLKLTSMILVISNLGAVRLQTELDVLFSKLAFGANLHETNDKLPVIV